MTGRDDVLTPAVPTPTPDVPRIDEAADGYVALVPRVLRAGQLEAVSLSLFQGDRPANSTVAVSLVKDGQSVVDASGWVPGRGNVSLPVPKVAEGEYQLRVRGKGFQDQTPVRVEDGTIVFLETDKPIYKPGQTVHMRVLALDPGLKPASGEATVEAMDAKGIKVFKRAVPVDDFGMAAVDLPLSTEPNLGVWKMRATIGKRSSQVDVRVERYVLPKYEVKVTLPKDWALVGQRISGTITAEYSFGKPVKGEAEVVASRYVGTWQEFARITRSIDSKVTFDLPAVGYVAGSPAAGGQGNVRLDVTVREQATGYEEQTSRLITIAQSPVTLRVIPEGVLFKPALPFSLLVVAESPDKQPVDTAVGVQITYQDANLRSLGQETRQVTTRNGAGLLRITPPAGATMLSARPAASNAAGTPVTVRAGYSPSGSFIHVEQVSRGPLKVGDTAQFRIAATRQATTFYYEVLSRGKIVFTDVSHSADLAVPLTPLMTPEARLLVYQLLPNAEVAADYLPFKVQGDYPHSVRVQFDRSEAQPGDALAVQVQTEGAARVGLAAVDRSVFILAENRLNLQQVFDELERLYQKPQIELHEARPLDLFSGIALPGARETFQNAGVTILSNRQVPAGKQLQPPPMVREAMPLAAAGAVPIPAPPAKPAAVSEDAARQDGQGLAEVQRVRQFFPETWLWTDLTTDRAGRAGQRVTAPDSITTWMLRGVALSKEKGLGIGEGQLRVFQPFFVQIDLPYSAIRGEELPAKVALYNYQPTAQEFTVEIEPAPWFDLLDARTRTVTVRPNDLGALAFTIRPTALGARSLKVTARSRSTADAIVKELIVEPEGVQREVVENLVLSPGSSKTVDLTVPATAIAGSARASLALTGNVLSQTIEGLEGLLQMPFGCGEQNMILFAPNVFVSRYLKETSQLKPEVMAKADKLMLTGLQRELTYRRNDGSFSAFGQQDKEGSLWLTAFVLKTFAQARDLLFVDESVLKTGAEWIGKHQNADGSFDPVGFVHHKELLGGLSGKTALTGYVAIALGEAGESAASANAVRYLEGKIGQTEDHYSLAISTYALTLAKSGKAQTGLDKLLATGRSSDEGLSWGDDGRGDGGQVPGVGDEERNPGRGPLPSPGTRHPTPARSAAIETTAYAALALLQRGDILNASRAVRWLASKRNAYGGYGSTQDTVVALQAMATSATSSRTDVDTTVRLQAGAWRKDVRISRENADVLQIVEVPVGNSLSIEPQGRGQVMAQAVRRFNVPSAEERTRSAFQLDVRYGAERVAVDDLITVTASVKFTPPEPIAAGMVVLDVAVPTGFTPVTDSLDALGKREPKLKRWDAAGRKVIFYIEDLLPNEQITFTFQAKALYPVRAQAVASQAYSYYRPEWRGEALAGEIAVGKP